MSTGILTYDDLLQIVQIIKSAEAFAEFRVKIGDIEIDLRKASPGDGAAQPAASAVGVRAPAKQELAESTAGSPAARAAATRAPTTPNAPSPPAESSADARRPDHAAVAPSAVIIRSPMVGTFYRAPEPGAKPFVDVGMRVTPEMTVCIIEVMKLMNSIAANCSGVVTHIEVEDAEPVGVGQSLIVIDPEG